MIIELINIGDQELICFLHYRNNANSKLYTALLSSSLFKILKTYKNFFQLFPRMVPVILPMAEMALTGSIYTILAVAIERFISVIRHFNTP